MIEKLKIRDIYNDFLYKYTLTSEETEVLDMLIKKETITAIALKLNMSEPKVSIIIKRLKEYFKRYEEFERLKIQILQL